MVKKKHHISSAQKVGMGIAATAAVATAAGAYFLYGVKDAAKNRKKVKGWMLKAKGEVLEGIEKVQHLDKESYHKLVDTVIARYVKLQSVGAKEAKELQKELKSHWARIHGSAKPKSKKRRTTAKKKKKSAPRTKTSKKKK